MFCVVSCWVSLYFCVVSLYNLGHTLTADLKDDSDIYRFHVILANAVLIKYGFCDRFVLTKLLYTFSMSLYGCALWSLDSGVIISILMFVLVTVCGVYGHYHAIATQKILHSVSCCYSVFNSLL